jgi:hypothetical protein
MEWSLLTMTKPLQAAQDRFPALAQGQKNAMTIPD